MKKVCLFNYPPLADFHGYLIETFDPLAYFPRGSQWTLSDLVHWGHVGFDHRRAITAGAAGVDRLYRERNRNYMRMVGDFVDRFRQDERLRLDGPGAVTEAVIRGLRVVDDTAVSTF